MTASDLPKNLFGWLVTFALISPTPEASAAVFDDVGYTLLQDELGASLPNGAGVLVTIVEADQNPGDGIISYSPNPANAEFLGKTLTDVSALTEGFSSHADSVGSRFFGNSFMAPGITLVDIYLADSWIGEGFLRAGQSQPRQPLVSSSRIANHSWVGDSDMFNSDILRRLDWIVQRDEYVNVVGYAGTSALLAPSFNSIAVNATSNPITSGTGGIDSVYTPGRAKPDMVAPEANPSNAAPLVASIAALLVELGHSVPGLSTDPNVTTTVSRNGDTLYNAERVEVVRAALMAGADRETSNTTSTDITDYRDNAADQTANGLDKRFGAGQLNAYHSYQIIAAGEQNNAEDDGGSGGQIGTHGFDYEPSFGGSRGSNDEGTYFFSTGADPVEFIAALVWNIEIDGGSSNNFDGAATLHDLDLFLYDVSDPGNWVMLGSSDSATENTENIYVSLAANTDLALQVRRSFGQTSFDWDYALAWRRFQPAPPSVDTDGDGIDDPQDNCTLVPNGPDLPDAGGNVQLDTDDDGFGNACDPDLNNDNVVDFSDLPALQLAFFAEVGNQNWNADADINGDDVVDFADLPTFQTLFFSAPGPSGLVP